MDVTTLPLERLSGFLEVYEQLYACLIDANRYAGVTAEIYRFRVLGVDPHADRTTTPDQGRLADDILRTAIHVLETRHKCRVEFQEGPDASFIDHHRLHPTVVPQS